MSGLRRKGKNVIWNVCVPEELAVKAELFLAGGASRPIYGLRSQIICSLLRKYIAEEEEKQQQAAKTAALPPPEPIHMVHTDIQQPTAENKEVF